MIDWFRIEKPLGSLITNFSQADVSVYRFNQKYLFDGNGKLYAVTVAIINIDGTNSIVDPQNIVEIVLTNEINNLCPVGTLTVLDPIGRIGELYNKFFTHIQICFTTYSPPKDKNADPILESTFVHTYIAENCELFRVDMAVAYRFKLRSILWYKLSGNIIYSTFGKTDCNIITSLKDCMCIALNDSGDLIKLISSSKSKAGSSLLDAESFNSNNAKELNYQFITPANSNIFDIFTDLTSRLYYNIIPPIANSTTPPKNIVIPPGLFYFVFDMMNAKYKMVTHGDETTYLTGATQPFTWIALRRKTTSEELVNQLQPEFGSMVGEDATAIYQTLLTNKIYYNYNPKLNMHHYLELKAETILGSLNDAFPRDDEKLKLQPFDAISEAAAKPDPANKQVTEFNSLISKILQPTADPTIYTRDYSFSDSTGNNPDVYREMINMMLYKDALVVTTGGEITHQPGMYFMINLDTATPVDATSNANLNKHYKTANLQFQGIFNIVRVTHIIRPGAKDPGERFRENVVLNKLTYPVKEPFA